MQTPNEELHQDNAGTSSFRMTGTSRENIGYNVQFTANRPPGSFVRLNLKISTGRIQNIGLISANKQPQSVQGNFPNHPGPNSGDRGNFGSFVGGDSTPPPHS